MLAPMTMAWLSWFSLRRRTKHLFDCAEISGRSLAWLAMCYMPGTSDMKTIGIPIILIGDDRGE
jgi:hypothetical protein